MEEATFLYKCSFHVNAKKDKECQVVHQLSFEIWNQNHELFTYMYTHISAICLSLLIKVFHYLPELFLYFLLKLTTDLTCQSTEFIELRTVT